MSGKGAVLVGPVEGAAGLKVAVVAARWHSVIMDGLLAGAQRALADSDVNDAVIVRVVGTFELGVAAARLAADGFHAIVALGVVIRGGTPHFDYVCSAATQALAEVSVRTGVPIGFGVLTCDNEQQALDRAGLPGSAEDKGYEVTYAALDTAVVLRQLSAARVE